MGKQPTWGELWAARWDALCAGIAGLIAWLAFAAGIVIGGGILIWQCFFYLREGVWPTRSALDVLYYVDPAMFGDWLMRPTAWLGVHDILRATPASIAVFLVGMAVGALAYGAHENLKS